MFSQDLSSLQVFITAHCCALAAFLVSLSYTQSVELLGKGKSQTQALYQTQDNANTE
jgi:hypothetical protein